MISHATVTINIRPEVKEKLERIASDTQRSESSLLDEAVEAYVGREMEVLDGIRRGLADAKAGYVISHEDAVAEMRAVVEDAKRRKAAG
jgi:predicted transcriptional regulator